MGCCFQDLFNITRSIIVQFPSSFFFSMRFVSVHVVYPYSRTDTTATWKKSRFILSDISVAVHAFARHILMSLSVNETLLPRLLNMSTNSRKPPLSVETFFLLKHMYSICLHSDGGLPSRERGKTLPQRESWIWH